MTTEVLITGALHSSAMEKFRSHDSFTVKYHPDCSRETLMQLLPSANVLVTRSETDVDQSVIEAAKNLKVVARAAVGVGNIDLEAATERGILVLNCPGKNTNSAAEMTLGLMLGMFRNIPQAHQCVKQGGWDRHRFTGRELRGKRIGIVGLGNVGHRVAKFARGFDMEVFAYDPYIAPEIFQRHGARQCSDLIEMASKTDILTLHVPLNQETKNMITSEVVSAMPKGSWLVNAARGGLFKEKDMIEFLNSGHLAGIAVDTFSTEPKPLKEFVDHARVWVSPHIGASTEEAQVAIGDTIFEQVVKAVERGVVDYPVNLPQVGVIDRPLLKSYAVLAEKLGSLVGQIMDFNPQRAEIHYRGDIAGLDHALIRMGFMKGYAQHVVDGFVSFVNVNQHFEKLGIKITETDDPGFQSYRSALKVSVFGDQGAVLTVGGIVFDEIYPRVTLVNDYYFEMEPEGTLLTIENHDRPGVIGDVGQFLASKSVNIDKFELSRNRRGGMAMSMIRIDSPLADEDLKLMRGIRNLVAVRPVFL
jgi:D-3-phosphoglycerate dehydrogenase